MDATPRNSKATTGAPVDLAILLRSSRAGAIAALRELQAQEPAFEAPVRLLRLDGGLVALLVEPDEAGLLRPFLGSHPAYRGVCRWERPPAHLAPVVANGCNAGDGREAKVRAFRREKAGEEPSPCTTAGSGSVTPRAERVWEAARGRAWRLLRTQPGARARRAGPQRSARGAVSALARRLPSTRR